VDCCPRGLITVSLPLSFFFLSSFAVNVHMPRDRVTNNHQNYGFVEFLSEEDAEYSIKVLPTSLHGVSPEFFANIFFFFFFFFHFFFGSDSEHDQALWQADQGQQVVHPHEESRRGCQSVCRQPGPRGLIVCSSNCSLLRDLFRFILFFGLFVVRLTRRCSTTLSRPLALFFIRQRSCAMTRARQRFKPKKKKECFLLFLSFLLLEFGLIHYSFATGLWICKFCHFRGLGRGHRIHERPVRCSPASRQIRSSLHLSVYLSIYLFVHLSIYLNLSFYQSINLSI
jgi:RNA recognition motif-containing protein